MQERRALRASGLCTWPPIDVTEIVKSWDRHGEGYERTSRICTDHTKPEVPAGHPGNGVGEATGYLSLELTTLR